MKVNKWKTVLLLLFSVLVFSVLIAMSLPVIFSVHGRTFTTDEDFDEGVLEGVEHNSVHDQLQLTGGTLQPYIWVPNISGTVSKVSTETGHELGRYRVAPHAECSPSRTTVDLQGNCWVGNRGAGTVVKIGLYEGAHCTDRNDDGTVQTSQDVNQDGDISGEEILPWGEDECVLYEVVLLEGEEGTYVPGNYTGPYDYDTGGIAPRGLAIDADNNLWAGTWSTNKYYSIDGITTEIIKIVDVSPWGHHAYGAVIDANGVLWSSGQNLEHVLILDPSTDTPVIRTLDLGHYVYGLGLDYVGHLFASGWYDRRLSRIDIYSDLKDWTKYKSELYQARGVVCTSDNDVWVASTANDRVYRYDNEGNQKATIYVGDGPTGVAVDREGKIWVCNYNDEYIKRIDPATNAVDLSKQIVGSGGHYSYSDMTGIISRTITTGTGTWTVVNDSTLDDTPWGMISWTGHAPEGSSISFRVRSSNDQAMWSGWEDAVNGLPLGSTPGGRYIQIEVTLQIISGGISPVLYDLTVRPEILPDSPSNPSPEDGAEDVNVSSALSWDVVGGAGAYDVYLWKSVEPKPENPTSVDQTATTYIPESPLDFVTAYRWQVVAKNWVGSTAGPEWTFTTEALPDLVGSDFDIPSVGYVGGQIHVGWRVTNFGDVIADVTWEDCLYLSDDGEAGGDIEMGCTERLHVLEPAEWYDRAVDVTIPGVSEGDYWVILKVDGGESVREYNENDNVVVAGPIAITRPNLTVGNISLPIEAWTGQNINVSWTVTNTGVVPATGDWQDCVYLSDDDQAGSDTGLGCFSRPADLDVGLHYNRIGTVPIPAVAAGGYWIVVKADDGNTLAETDEDDNDAVEGTLPVHVSPCADLEPGDLGIPTEPVPAGTAAFVDWQVTNLGDGPTNAPYWFDRIYLSTDAMLDEEDRRITPDFQNPMALNPGETYVQAVEFTVPGDLEGDYYVIIEADAGANLSEGNETNNVAVSNSVMQIEYTEQAMLTVTDVQVDPSNPWRGDPVTVTWTITNTGGLPTGSFQIDHAIVLSDDDTLDYPGDRVLDWHCGDLGTDLDPGDTSDPVSVAVEIPWDVWGDYYMIVWPDPPLWVDLDRTPGSALIQIQAAMPTDLVVDTVSAPDTGMSGQPIQATWTVRNASTEATHVSVWKDKVFLSVDDDFSTTGDNILLGTFTHEDPLGFDEFYESVENVSLPVTAAGLYHVFVHTDAEDVVYEEAWEDNNVGRAPDAVDVTYAPPDLQPVSIDLLVDGAPPASIPSGSPITLEWTVTNGGTGSVPNAGWSDKIYISEDGTLDTGDRELADLRHMGSLGIGGTYQNSQTVSLPVDITGPAVTIFLCTDSDEEVYESDDSNNCMAASPFEVTWSESDLTLSGVTAERTAPEADTIQVSWTVLNVGGETTVSTWLDRIYLSLDPWLDTGDTQLQEVVHNGTLGHQESYYRSEQNIPLPQGFSGTYYVIVETDAPCPGVVVEPDEGNNTGCASFPLDLGDNCKSDLAVSFVHAPPTACSSQFMSLQWSVTNQGSSPTNRESWWDVVYLSPDQYLDRDTDLYLGYMRHEGLLASGQSYDPAATLEVRIPSGLSGPYYVFLVTDSSDSVCEADEANNQAYDGEAVLIELSPPPDLVMIDITLPSSAMPGDMIEVSWTAKNQGDFDAQGSWMDAVYLSADATWDIQDTLLGYASSSGPLTPGEQYTGSLNVEIPGLLPGAYHAIVRADIRNQVREGSDESNNIGVSSATISVDVTELMTGIPSSRQLQQGEMHYYRVEASPDADLLIKLDSQSEESHNELYVSAGAIPSPASYDFVQETPFSPDKEISVPNTTTETYFILVRGGYVPDGPASYTITATSLEFSIRAVSPATVGDCGEVTLDIRGAKFDEETTFRLEKDGESAIEQDLSFYIDSTRMYAILPTQDASNGSWNIVAIDADSNETVLSGAVDIQECSHLPVEISFIGPQAVRASKQKEKVYLSIRNPRNVNVERIILFLKAPAEIQILPDTHIDELFPWWKPSEISDHSILAPDGNKWLWFYMYDITAGKTFEFPITFSFPPEQNTYLIRAEGLATTKEGFKNVLNEMYPQWVEEENQKLQYIRTGTKEDEPLYVDRDGDTIPDIFDFCLNTPPNLKVDERGCSKEQQRDEDRIDKVLRDINKKGPEHHNLRVSQDMVVCVTEWINIEEIMLYLAATISDLAVFKGIMSSLATAITTDLDSFKDAGELIMDEIELILISPIDPNEKKGQQGFGNLDFVATGKDVFYTIRFENLSDATAPAQQVRIIDGLDTNLDLRTFRLTEIAFGDHSVTIPENRSYYHDRISLGDEMEGLLLDIDAGLDVQTGEVHWLLTSIDPETGEIPEDPLAGFLPPNDEEGSGEGYVTFTVRPLTAIPTGTVITNRATIYFDHEEPIETNEVFNTVDGESPSSSVDPLPEVTESSTANISWSGSDDPDGSGLGSYFIYVSKDGEPYQQWITTEEETSALFEGEEGHTYSFYSLAQDNAGNMENPPEEPDAVTTFSLCQDADGDGYMDNTCGGTDCVDDPSGDPATCTACDCGTTECAGCARCIHPGAKEFSGDNYDSNCNGNNDCFIATAAFGTEMAGKLALLREIRDQELIKNPHGEALVDLYYNFSPPIADFIAERDWLKGLVRTLLLPVVGLVSLFV